ncbi:MAG: aminoacyl-tRNA hydrolase [Elusimicrobia bacterium]|nr:aminoacyl-tRNA hydrolase [Elusimicrobiota bacterium]
MEGALRFVVGLGNPGPSYRGTRHNVGRDFLDHVAEKQRESFSSLRQSEILRLPAFFGDVFVEPVTFAKLGCFMNESGPALRRLLGGEGFGVEGVLVIVDDFMLPFGSLRLRPDGSSGGHNGLKSIIETFGTESFPRLRVGVGPVPEKIDPRDFVLGRFNSTEKQKMPDLYAAMGEAVKAVLAGDIQSAMNRTNKAHFE